MHRSPIALLLIGLVCASVLGCELDLSSIPIGRARDAGEPPGKLDAGPDAGDDGAEAGLTDDVDMVIPDAGSELIDAGSDPDAGGGESDGSDGDVSRPPSSATGCPGPACDFVAFCGGNYFSCGVVRSGRAVCWGDNSSGQLGRTGTSRAFGYVESEPEVPLERVSQLACGTQHACAVLEDHSVRCWGAGDEGQLGDGVADDAPYSSKVVAIPAADQVVAGHDLSCARLQSGQVSCWGKNAQGQLGRGSVTDEVLTPGLVAELSEVTALSLRTRTVYAVAGANRALFAWGTGRGAAAVPILDESWSAGLTDVRAVAAGTAHGCFVVGPEKRVLCSGWDAYGQIGQGDTGCEGWCENARPVQHETGSDSLLSGVDELMVNANSACVLLSGQVRCWGANSYGELGIGVANFAEFDPSLTLIRTSAGAALAPEGEEGALVGVLVMGGGYRHFCAQRTAGELLCWGHGEAGQLGVSVGASARPMIITGM